MKNAKNKAGVLIIPTVSLLVLSQAALAQDLVSDMDFTDPAPLASGGDWDVDISISDPEPATQPQTAVFAGPAELPAGDAATMGEATIVLPATEPMPERSISPSVDPMAREELERLDRLGFVRQATDIGKDVLLIERDVRRAETVAKLVEFLGVDAFRLQYPELAEQLRNSPILLKADLEREKTLAEIRVARGDVIIEEPAGPTSRSDGSDYFDDLNLASPVVAEEPEEAPSMEAIEKMIAEAVKEATKPSEEILKKEREAYAPISLREVYGLDGELVAVIIHGTERIRVRVGDELPAGTVVKAIDEDAVVITRDGVDSRLPIRG